MNTWVEENFMTEKLWKELNIWWKKIVSDTVRWTICECSLSRKSLNQSTLFSYSAVLFLIISNREYGATIAISLIYFYI